MKCYYQTNNESVEKRKESIRKALQDPEFKKRQSEQTKKQFQDPEFYRKYRELRSSEEYRNRISKAHKGLKQSDETRTKKSIARGIPVICVETGEIFHSARAAARAMPGNINVNAVINGTRLTAGGYHWKLLETVQRHKG